ncbi:MAG: efflux RND transporter periplasmic adaptor subunit [Calditrichaeota bacterium]|nr:MAG: efflux RND transporter periplasmic adaptor subunit [Calditrichota bacterium]
MVKKVILTVCFVAVVGAVLFFALDGSAKKDDGYKTVAVEKGSIIDLALAVGRIEPRKEVNVKSKIPGIVKKIFVDIGDKVSVGDPLFEIAPDPTPIELSQAKRELEIRQNSYDNAKREFDRVKSLKEKDLVAPQDYDSKEAACEEERLRLEQAKEKLSLLESGRMIDNSKEVANIIRSTVSGTVLSRMVEEGDPVVPLTSYQAGTDLMSLAKMDDLIFKGNVDEIDVGKLHVGMMTEIEIGALSSKDKIEGKLTKISPKAHKEDGSTMFGVEIEITDQGNKYLRAGYSANAEVIITKKEDILLIPERLLVTRDSSYFVEIEDSLKIITEREVHTGLSDGIKIEVVDGVDEGELIVERPPKEISVSD